MSALSRAQTRPLRWAAMHARAVLGMMGAHVRMTLTSALRRRVRTVVFALSRARMAVLLWEAMHVLAVRARFQ